MSDKRTPVVEDIEGTNLYLRKGASQRFIEKHCEHCCDGNNQLRINLKKDQLSGTNKANPELLEFI